MTTIDLKSQSQSNVALYITFIIFTQELKPVVALCRFPKHMTVCNSYIFCCLSLRLALAIFYILISWHFIVF